MHMIILIYMNWRVDSRTQTLLLAGLTESSSPVETLPSSAGRLGLLDVERLVYELRDAHEDTARMALERSYDDRWDAHLDYLALVADALSLS